AASAMKDSEFTSTPSMSKMTPRSSVSRMTSRARGGSPDGLGDVPLPDRPIVREVHADRIELVESRDPIGIRRVLLAGQRELVRVLMPRVIRREAEGLSGEGHTAFLRIDDDRLMAGRMAGCRHDVDARPGLGVSIDLLERGGRKIRDMRKRGVVVRP